MIENIAVNKAIDYILEHIGDDLSVEEVASHCNLSVFHFCRLFKRQTGEGIHQFIKREKMEQSAFRLKTEKRSITDIALDYGYSSSNFSSSFHDHLHLSPAAFRKGCGERSIAHPFFKGEGKQVLDSYEECCSKTTLETLPVFRVVYERRKGTYLHLGDDWDDFIGRYQSYLTDRTLFIERTFDDPSITETDSCLYDICMTVGADCPLQNVCTLDGGLFAVRSYEGKPEGIYAAYQSLFNVWLPQSGHSVDERYGFVIYRSVDCATREMSLDICIPVR
jgi:AraC family transcriptional regulator